MLMQHRKGNMHLKVMIAACLAVFLISCTFEQPKEESVAVAKNASQAVQETKTTEPAAQIKCRNDDDCGGRVLVDQPHCFQGHPEGTVKINRCVNPGTANSYCVSETKTGAIQECADGEFCKGGECLAYKCNDSDGGLNFAEKGEVRINDGSVYDDYCEDKGHLIEYYCSSDNRAFSKEEFCDCKDDVCTNERYYRNK